MPVQDDAREQELCNLFNLEWDPEHSRGGDDAWFEYDDGFSKPIRIPVEVKSTTNDTISTARDVGLQHIEKWRKKLWVIGFYDSSARRPKLVSSLCLTPVDLEPWIKKLEDYISPDFKIGELGAKYLNFDDLYAICGEKKSYSLEDARSLYKRQWNVEQYKTAMDLENGYSPAGMLKILRSRLEYLVNRGSTLNNPHITKKFLAKFNDQRIVKEHAAEIRHKFRVFIEQNGDKF